VTGTCPASVALEHLLADALSAREEEALEAHVAGCASCQGRLEELTRGAPTSATRPAAAEGGHEKTPSPGGLVGRLAGLFPETDFFSVRGAAAGPAAEAKPHSVRAPPPATVTLPGYDILECLGTGGAAVVYRAVHQPLKRPVALKFTHEHLQHHAEDLARFRAEAKGLARLRHPNIVQVYDVGEHQGRLYLSLELVLGGSLARHCRGTPQSPRHAAELVETVARAIHHAHRQGLIHRDLKPGNILLHWEGPPPADRSLKGCVPKITDFGLVKDLNCDASLTRTGEVYGTPNYMAPEQAVGSRGVGPAADVWALGAILYELLTGRPPFAGASALDTLLLVRSQDPVPVRRLQPLAPRDLEIICLKCLEKESARRYGSAEALADDLQRYRRGEAIQARPASTPTRLWRWCRRNPRVAVLTAAVALLLLVLGMGGALTAVYQTRLRHKAEASEAAALEQKKLANENFGLANEAVEDTIKKLVENAQLKQANFHELRKELLEGVVPHLEELVKEKAGDPEMQARRGRAYLQLGTLRNELGHFTAAQEAYQQSIELFAQLAEANPKEPSYRDGLVNGYRQLGWMLALRRDHQAEGERYLGQGVEIGRQIAAAPDDPNARFTLSCLLSMHGYALNRHGLPAQAESQLTEALQLQEELTRTYPKLPPYWEELAYTHDRLSLVLAERAAAEPPMAAQLQGGREEHQRRAVEIWEKLTADVPREASYRFGLAAAALHLAQTQEYRSRPEDAVRTYEQALPVLQKLVEEFPAVPDYRNLLAGYHTYFAGVLQSCGRPSDGESHLRLGLENREKLAAEFPDGREYKVHLADAHTAFGKFLKQAGRVAEAEAQLRRGLEVRTRLAVDNPEVLAYACQLGVTYCDLGSLVLDQGGHEAGLGWFGQAVTVLLAARTRGAVPAWTQDPLRRAHDGSAVALERLGRHAAAADELARAIAETTDAALRLRSRAHRTVCLAHAGQYGPAVQEAEELAREKELAGNSLCDLAHTFALAAAVAKDDNDLAERYAARAVELLVRARDKGGLDRTFSRQEVEQDPDFAALGRRDDFKKLIADLKDRLPR
jgi:tetratricopeptide (TPR) repeat protein/tRNA A-37 threonylcarbamoyl transferase component Bud32